MSLLDKIQRIERKLLSDERGWFLKILNGKEDFLPAHTGEIYMTMAKPGEWRANHYHPLTAEWFTVFSGTAKVILEDVETRDRLSFDLSADKPETLFVPPGVAHVFINNSDVVPMFLIAYAENQYDPSDTVPYNIADTNGV